jgi:hypothetical protein
MSRLDPDFRIDQQGNPSSARRPYPDQLTPREGRPRPKSEDFERYEKALAEINAQVLATPTPITDTLGKGTPKEAIFHEKVKEVARQYGVDERGVQNYVSKHAFPGGRSGHQLWEGGYGINAVSALRRFEQQANFFRQTEMTPLEAAVKRYDGITSMKSRESEVASALGIPNYGANQKRREYLATAQERRDNVMKIVSDPYQKAVLLQKIDEELEELKRLRAEDRRGGKKRKTRKSKKSARKTRRRA